MYAWLLASLVFMPCPQKKGNMPGFIIENNQDTSVTPKLIDVPVLSSRMSEQSVLADIVNRTEQPNLTDSRTTNGHESTHFLNNQLRNKLGGRINVYYILNGKAIVVNEPGIRMSMVGQFVPRCLRKSRFDLYVIQQGREYDDRPSYLGDEWSAYINGACVAVDDKNNNRYHQENSDQAVGGIELGIYCVAMAMAVEKYDSEFFKTDPTFKPFMQYQWKRAKEVFDKAAPLFPWDTQDELVRDLNNSPDAEAMRQFIKTHLNGVWLK